MPTDAAPARERAVRADPAASVPRCRFLAESAGWPISVSRLPFANRRFCRAAARGHRAVNRGGVAVVAANIQPGPHAHGLDKGWQVAGQMARQRVGDEVSLQKPPITDLRAKPAAQLRPNCRFQLPIVLRWDSQHGGRDQCGPGRCVRCCDLARHTEIVYRSASLAV